MMKKLNLKGLHVGSPRREGVPLTPENGVGPGTSNPHSGSNSGCVNPHHHHHRTPRTPDYSPEDSGGLSQSDFSNDSHTETVVTPKRKTKKGILKTLRRKFTPSRKKEENIENSPSHTSRASRWHEEQQHHVERCHRRRSGSHSADRTVIRSRSCHTHYPGSLNRPHKSHIHSIHSKDNSSTSSSSSNGRQRSEEESEKETEAVNSVKVVNSVKAKPQKTLFPFDTEYGHASAPFNGDDNENSIPIGFEGTPIRGSSPPHCSRADSSSPVPGDTFEQYSSSGDSQHSIVGIVCLPPNVYDQVKDPPKESSWSLSKELFKLSKFGWYWGPITRIEAEEKLVGHPDGAFLVRDSSDERYLLSLSFCSYGRTLHTRIEHCNGVFSFYAQPECEGYSSIVDLIEHSMNDSQTGVFCYSRARTPGSPSFPVRLTKPVSRFTQVRTLQYLCRFVIRQYTRFDHIQTLPLPTSIKGWLLENQY